MRSEGGDVFLFGLGVGTYRSPSEVWAYFVTVFTAQPTICAISTWVIP